MTKQDAFTQLLHENEANNLFRKPFGLEGSHDDLAAVCFALTSATKVMGTLKTFWKGEH